MGMTIKLKIKSKFNNFFKLIFKPLSAGIVKRIKIDPIKSPFIGKKYSVKLISFLKVLNLTKDRDNRFWFLIYLIY